MGKFTAFLAGLIFGLGLLLSRMANPEKVLGFLDLAGRWDPSLAFVMAGAIGMAAVAFAVARRRTKSLLGVPLQWPTATRVDPRLIGGSTLFGIGWGLAGFCPGPALVAAAAGQTKAVLFVAAMAAGMFLFAQIERLRAKTH